MKKIKKVDTPNLDEVLTAKILAKAVKARRTQSGLRLVDAAALCGVAKQTLLNIEHGRSIQLGSALKICAGLGIKLVIKPWFNEKELSDDWQ